MIASQHTESTRIDRERFMQTKLHGKISNGMRIKFRMSLMRPCIRLIHIRIKISKHTIKVRQIILIFRELIQTRATDLAQESNRVVMKPLP